MVYVCIQSHTLPCFLRLFTVNDITELAGILVLMCDGRVLSRVNSVFVYFWKSNNYKIDIYSS